MTQPWIARGPLEPSPHSVKMLLPTTSSLEGVAGGASSGAKEIPSVTSCGVVVLAVMDCTNNSYFLHTGLVGCSSCVQNREF